MKIAIITNCSKSKKQKATQGLMATNLKPGSLDQVSNDWSKKVNESTLNNLTAKDQYVGRSFKEVKKKLDKGIYQEMGEKGAILS